MSGRNNSDDWDDDEPRPDTSDEIQRRKVNMSDDQRKRFEVFQEKCKFPHKRVLEVMQKAVPQSTVQVKAARVGAWAAKLFTAELIETARRLSGNNAPLTPDLIMIAFNELESHGKIPGRGPGIRRADLM